MPTTALIQFVLLLAVLTAYGIAARRYRRLRHPFIIAVAVIVVGVVVSVLGEFFRGGWAGVPAMAWRSFIGSAWWGALIGVASWIVCRLRSRGSARRAPHVTSAE